MGKRYLIDSSILINAHRQLYPFDIAPGFWDQLLLKGGNNLIFIKSVERELIEGGDQLSSWYLENKDNFTSMDVPCQQVTNAYNKIINQVVKNAQYNKVAKDDFASKADSWLCAYGLAFKYTIVTNEQYRAEIKKRVPIPNVCREFNIDCLDLVQFMRENTFRL